MLGGDVSTRHGLDDRRPDIGSEEGCVDVGVVEVQYGSGEGFEGGCGCGGEIYYLWVLSA